MARKQFTGTGRVKFAPTVVNLALPTIAEITAAVDLTCFMRQDGLDRSQEAAVIDVADACSLFDKTDIGTRNANLTMTLYRDSEETDDDAWSALPIGTRGFLIVAMFGFSGVSNAPVAGDRCEVWPVAVSSRSNNAIAKNEPQIFSVTFAVPEAPNDDAVVAAA